MAICSDWLMYLLWNFCCVEPRFSRGHEIRWGYANTRLPRFEGGIMPSMLNAEKVMTPDIRQKFFPSLNEHDLQIRMDACLLWELWCGQSVLPWDDSSMVIGAIDANLGLQIVLQDCGWAALAGFCLARRLKTERRLQPVTHALYFFTQLHKRFCMTDYSGAIFALIAITSVLTAAVVFVLAQPTDLPVVKKAQGWRASSSHLNSPKQWIRKTFSFFSSVLVLHVSLWISIKLIVHHSTSLFFGSDHRYSGIAIF